MGERRYTTRPPLRELDLAFNPNQPRDSHGRWVKAGGEIESAVRAITSSKGFQPPGSHEAALRALAPSAPKGHAALTDAQKAAVKRVPLQKTKGHLVKTKVVEPTPEDVRTLRKLGSNARMAIYHEAGLKLQFPHLDDDQLLEEWHRTRQADQGRREALLKEIELREDRLTVIRKAMHQSMLDARREGKRDQWRRFDTKLKSLPGGNAIIGLRERLLKDKWLDKKEGLTEWFHHHGKHYAGHVVTVVAIASVLHPIGLATIGGLGAAGVLNVPGASEAFTALMENLWVHSGLATALAPVADKLTGPAFDWLSRERRIERAKKYAAKHPTRKLHV
jgi:hypothetical protein